MSLRRARLAALIGLLAGLGGCTLVADQELFDPIDDQPPAVVATLPEDGWIQVPTDIAVRVWFSEPVDPQTVHQQSLVLFSGEELADVSYRVDQEADGRGLVVLQPQRRLIAGVLYTLRVTSQITDRFGNPLPVPVVLSFRTMR